jgi:hypothetical protein
MGLSDAAGQKAIAANTTAPPSTMIEPGVNGVLRLCWVAIVAFPQRLLWRANEPR